MFSVHRADGKNVRARHMPDVLRAASLKFAGRLRKDLICGLGPGDGSQRSFHPSIRAPMLTLRSLTERNVRGGGLALDGGEPDLGSQTPVNLPVATSCTAISWCSGTRSRVRRSGRLGCSGRIGAVRSHV
jgi:hypothetical protein